ncbi:hypothetical protein QOZ80_8BG0644100 [Eleusine coracana subsp. coracana]|nr:hypothetical protein QOZ80_8BG0644100 [Eleusine coracana subsp. coracana]
MENSSTEALSYTANHSFSGTGDGGNASEESGWTSYIDYFMETQRRQEEEASSAASSSTEEEDVGRRSSSQYSCDCAVACSSRLPALIEPSEASRRRRLRIKKGRGKKVMYDESLEDTATSPISSPKLIELREADANHHMKEDARDEFSRIRKPPLLMKNYLPVMITSRKMEQKEQ